MYRSILLCLIASLTAICFLFIRAETPGALANSPAITPPVASTAGSCDHFAWSLLLFFANPPAVENTTQPASRAELEDRFKRGLTNVVFRGTWQMTNAEGLKGKAPLTPPRTERYTIRSVSKGLGDNWVITARVQFADRDVELPFNVRVVWAGDTPIITLDKTALPLLGTYSARVMVYDGFYAGAWFGTNYGGILSGQIIKTADEKMIEALEKDADKIKLPPKPAAKLRQTEPRKTEPRP